MRLRGSIHPCLTRRAPTVVPIDRLTASHGQVVRSEAGVLLPLIAGVHVFNNVYVGQRILDEVPLALAMWDREDRLVHLNPAAQALLQVEAWQVGQPLAEVLPRVKPPAQPGGPFELVIGEGQGPRVAGTAHPWRDFSGQVLGTVAYFLPADQGAPMAELDVLDELKIGYMALGFTGHLVSVNRTMAKLVGLTPADLVGQDYETVLRQFMGASRTSHVLRALRAGEPVRTVETFDSPMGRVELEVLAVTRASGPVRVACMVRDVTQERAREEHARLSVVGEIAAAAAHEIRNPLSTVRGYMQLVARGQELTDKHRQYLEGAIRELDRMNLLLDDLLHLSRPAKPGKAAIDLAAVVEGVLAPLSSQPEGPPVEVVFRRQSVPLVHGNEHQLRQLVLNLVRNAVEAMPQGGRLSVDLAASPDMSVVVLRVGDTGVGIPEEDLGRIFEPFFTSKEEGTGLGLVVSRQIVEAHGGHITVDSRPGEGTVFSVTLPVLSEQGAAGVTPPPRDLPGRSPSA